MIFADGSLIVDTSTHSNENRCKEPRVVLYYIPEDPLYEVVIHRLIALKAEFHNFRIQTKKFSLIGKKGLDRLRRDIDANNPAMAVIDPATAYSGSLDLEKRNQALEFVYALDDVASEFNIPIIAN